MKKFTLLTTSLVSVAMLLAACGGESSTQTSSAQPTTQAMNLAGNGERCHVVTSHYVGWYPAEYIQSSGIAATMGNKYNVDLKIDFMEAYGSTIERFTAGDYDGITITTLDALIAPAASGVNTEIVVNGDFSNGNDAVLVINSANSVSSPKDLVGRDINLVQGSVSEYLFDRWLSIAGDGLTVADFNITNTTDTDMLALIANAKEGEVYVTWNPFVFEAMQGRPDDLRDVFNSSQIPGEILDTIAMNANASDACKVAVSEAWYTAMAEMSGPNNTKMLTAMANFATGGSNPDTSENVAWYNAQLATTNMFYAPSDAIAVAKGSQLQKTMQSTYDFASDRGMLTSQIGVQFPDGSVVGDANNVTMTFTTKYMEAAAAALSN